MNRGRGKRRPCRAWPRTVGGVRDTFETSSEVYVRTPQLAPHCLTKQQPRGRGSGQAQIASQGKLKRGTKRRSDNKRAPEQRSKGSSTSPLRSAEGKQLAADPEEMISDVTTPLAPPSSLVMNGSSRLEQDQPGAGMGLLLINRS